MSSQPTPEQLHQWHDAWNKIRRAAYADLVASYTPTQREIVARINEAQRNEARCKERMKRPAGVGGERAGRVAWPNPPP